MPRKARIVVVGQPHHITQRGNNCQPVFFRDSDRQAYLDRLFAYAENYCLRVWAYCLMTNHVHVVCVPEKNHSLAKVFGRLHADYARAVNFRREASGHLWQERFYSCAMERRHAMVAMAYVEQNPQRAAIVRAAEEYRWSSARVHLRGEDPSGQLDLGVWRAEYTPARWRDVLASSVMEDEEQQRFREATLHGRPFGSEGYVERLESELGVTLRPRPRGRPRKMSSVHTPDTRTASGE
jgi:putative transposase